MLEFFSSASQAPINLETADSSAGADYIKEQKKYQDLQKPQQTNKA